MREFLAEPLARARAEQAAAINPAADREAVCVLVSTAVLLTIQFYVFRGRNVFAAWEWCAELLPAALARQWDDVLRRPENSEIVPLAFWAAGQVLVYVVGPLLLMRFVIGRRPRDYGAKLAGLTRGWPIYLFMAGCILPGVWAASYSREFQHTYPFYRLGDDEPFWPRFVVWEVLYCIQFIALEFFFRGYLLHGTRRRLGPYSILAMMIPYCMIHFGKPPLETCGAIFAGMILGFMSLKTGSIWLGAALHILVALSMDGLALWHRFG